MAITSWIRWPMSYRPPKPVKTPRRQPLRPRLWLESLESRLLLNAGTPNQFGVLNNPSINFNPPAIGVTLPAATPPVTAGQTNGNVSLPTVNALEPAGAVAFASPLAQGQVYDQFRVFGVNSQGQGNQPQVAQQLYSMSALGFGSGVQPNAPWHLASDNLGLGNHQFNYSSQTDSGFQSVPPWYRTGTTAWNKPQSDENLPDDRMPDEQATEEQATVLVKHEEETELKRGDPAIEEALFSEPPATLLVNHLGPRARQRRDRSGDDQPIPLEEERGVPSPVWLSALSPAQFTALIAGLSVMEAPSGDGGDDVAMAAAE